LSGNIANVNAALHLIKAGLHNGDYRFKLVRFEAQKNIFNVKKGPSLDQFTPLCKHHLSLK
jgi:hypothetical protein